MIDSLFLLTKKNEFMDYHKNLVNKLKKNVTIEDLFKIILSFLNSPFQDFLLTFGRTIDIFWDLTFFTFDDAFVLLLVKIRYFIIIFEVAPLIYLGFEIIFFKLEDRFTKLKDKKFMNRLRTRIIAIIVGVESVTIIIVPNITLLGMVLPIILIPSLLGIVYIFYLAYRYNRLKMVKPKILTIGFLLYMISNILRPVMQSILGETANYVILVELVDLCIFLVIFLGLYKKT